MQLRSWYIWVFGVTFTSFADRFGKHKTCQRKKATSPRSYHTSQHIYICMLTLYTYTNTYMPRYSHLDFCSLPSVLSWLLGSHPSTSGAVCVCVCVRVCTHIHPHTHPPSSQNRENTDKTFIFPCVKNNIPRQQQVPWRHLFNPRKNTVDIDGRFGSTYMRIRSI